MGYEAIRRTDKQEE